MKGLLLAVLATLFTVTSFSQVSLTDGGNRVIYRQGSVYVNVPKSEVKVEKPATPTSLVYLYLAGVKYGINYTYYTPTKTSSQQVWDTINAILTTQDTSIAEVYWKAITSTLDTIKLPANTYKYVQFRVDTGTVTVMVDATATAGIPALATG